MVTIKLITTEDVQDSLDNITQLRRMCFTEYLSRLTELNQLEEDLNVLMEDVLEHEKN